MKSLSVVGLLLGFVVTANAGEAPRLPCDGSSVKPSFGPLGSPPNVRVWASGALGDNWRPPACTGWAPAAGTLVALAGKFRFEGSADDLLTRMGAISALRGIRYWSVSDNAWRTLIEHASALDVRATQVSVDEPEPVEHGVPVGCADLSQSFEPR